MSQAKSALSKLGLETSIDVVPGVSPTGVNWPNLDVWVGLRVTSLFDFLTVAEHVLDPLEQSFEATRKVVVVPIREDQLIGSLAMHGGSIEGHLLPLERPSQGWPSVLNMDWAELSLHRKLEQLVDGALRYTCLEGLSEKRPLVGEEVNARQEAEHDIAMAESGLAEAMTEDSSDFLHEVLQPIVELLNKDDFAGRMARQLRGEDEDTLGVLALVRLSLMEWDLDRETARNLLNDFMKRVSDDGLS